MKAVNLNELLLGLTVHQDIDPQYLRGWTPIKIQFRRDPLELDRDLDEYDDW
jgi:hypothetical protein